MTRSIQHPSLRRATSPPDAIALLVGLTPSAIGSPSSDSFSCTDSGREALALLKVLRFRWLLTNLDVPDMRPWELFERARRSRAGVQCILVDDRLTVSDERLVRQAGAAAFALSDPGLCEVIDRVWRRGDSRAPAVDCGMESLGSSLRDEPARAPP